MNIASSYHRNESSGHLPCIMHSLPVAHALTQYKLFTFSQIIWVTKDTHDVLMCS